MTTCRRFAFGWAGMLAACLGLLPLAASAATEVVQPLPLPGPYPVACSNAVQDFSRLAPGEDVQTYWEGVPRSDGSGRYITDLLADPGNTLSVTVTAPNDGAVFGSFAGQNVLSVVVVCYPTTADNPRANYPLPNGNIVPHMQVGTDGPLLADSAARFPLLVFSHGLLASPLSNEYLMAMGVFASYGYVVAAPFHGDPRIAPLQPDSFRDYVYLLAHLRDFNAMQALRPLTLSATIDLMLTHPQWRDHVDAGRIGGFGASLGGESLLLMAGGGLTTSVGLSWSNIVNDTRLKAAVGYVPYFGQPIFPAFGRDQHGLDNVTLPFLAISGTADTTAPLASTAQGIDHLAGPRELVTLIGVTHSFDVPSTNDIFTWALTFLNAEVRGDQLASSQLAQMASVAGGGDDRVVFSNLSTAPATPAGSPNYGGLWWNSPAGSEDGWGLTLAHQGDVIFAAWFTYDQAGHPLWMVMTANIAPDGAYSGTLYQTKGPGFSAVPFDPAAVVRTPVGTGTLAFAGAGDGTFTYTVNGVTQSKPITRQVFGTLPTCTFGAQPNLALATNYQDLWWNPAESGWGLSLTQQGNVIFGAWFTYEQDGTPVWLTFTAVSTQQTGIYLGTLYLTSGPAFSAVPFNRAAVSKSPVGTAFLTFADGNNATFAYTAFGITQAKSITREVFRVPGTVCQ